MYSTLSLLFTVFIVSPCLAMEIYPVYTISDYRLSTKDRPNAGIVEVFHQDTGWGLVCQTNWTFELASIACRHLNFPGTSRDLTAVDFNDDDDKWPISVTKSITTYFGNCLVDGTSMQCDACIECFCHGYYRIRAVSCKEPGYLGCFSDYYNHIWFHRDRLFSNGYHYYYNLTIDLCINACEKNGSFYAGIEYKRECFCGRQDENLAKHGIASDGECNYDCAGDRRESCGGADKIAIYQVGLGVCKDPGTPRYGFRYNLTGSLRYGSKIYFNCLDGYTLEGPDAIQCVQMYGRRVNVSIANSTHAVMWNYGLPKCTGFSSTTPSSAITKDGGQINRMIFIATAGLKQQCGHQIIIYVSICIASGILVVIIIIAIMVVVVVRTRQISKRLIRNERIKCHPTEERISKPAEEEHRISLEHLRLEHQLRMEILSIKKRIAEAKLEAAIAEMPEH